MCPTRVPGQSDGGVSFILHSTLSDTPPLYRNTPCLSHVERKTKFLGFCRPGPSTAGVREKYVFSVNSVRPGTRTRPSSNPSVCLGDRRENRFSFFIGPSTLGLTVFPYPCCTRIPTTVPVVSDGVPHGDGPDPFLTRELHGPRRPGPSTRTTV